MANSEYINGYIERKAGGEYCGELSVEGISLSPLIAQYFKQDGENYLWLRRKPLLEYNMQTQKYSKREREPRFEVYMKKQIDGETIAYVGVFLFMRFKFKIVGVWDSIMGRDKKRLNLYVDRLPMKDQTIINSINERIKNEKR